MTERDVILKELESALQLVVENDVDALITELMVAPRIFVIGEGRSGLMMKAFAMRLMHLGLTVYVHGETTTPAVQSGDLVVAASGSGTTQSVLVAVQAAKNAAAKVLVLTVHPQSPIAVVADHVFHVPAATRRPTEGEVVSQQLLSSLYDQCIHVILDGVCMRLSHMRSDTSQDILARHSNL